MKGNPRIVIKKQIVSGANCTHITQFFAAFEMEGSCNNLAGKAQLTSTAKTPACCTAKHSAASRQGANATEAQ